MKILFLTPVLPWPLFSGGQIRAYNLLKELQKKHEVTLVSYIRNDKEREYLPQLLKIAKRVFFIKRNLMPWAIKILVKTLFSSKPLVMNLYDTGKLVILGLDDYDFIWC